MAVFVVEGTHDVERLEQAFPNIETIMIYGTKFNGKAKGTINDYLERGEKVYILTDPDKTGKETAKRIKHYYKDDVIVIHANPEECKCRYETRWKYGIEYCNVEYLRKLLSPYMEEVERGNIIDNSSRCTWVW